MKAKFEHIILLLAIPLIIGFQFGQSNFSHYHTLKNGKVIKHSHPYKTNGKAGSIPKHNHSSSELMLLQLFDGNFSAEFQTVNTDDITPKYLDDKLPIFEYQFYSFSKKNRFLLRGPPVLV